MRVLVAMSGGVDSSVAAAELVAGGHEVVGVTMRLWGGASDTGCCSVADVDDARRVAQQLGVEHHVFNFGEEFDARVVAPYVADHAAGRTPNPCVECNRHLKFDKLLRRADALGFDAVATGHHARRVVVGDGTWRIARGADAAKDQSYVLYPMDQDALARTWFPLGHLTKGEVRARADRWGLRTAHKPDSQDVCFIARSQGRRAFLEARVELTPGRVVDTAGDEVGRVDAIELVTLGQRKGLDLAGGRGRRFVVDVDVAARTVVVGDDADLRTSIVRLGQVVRAAPGELRGEAGPGRLTAQASAHGAPRGVSVRETDDGIELRWDEPQRRVAPGQSVVVYDGDVVLGGGIVR